MRLQNFLLVAIVDRVEAGRVESADREENADLVAITGQVENADRVAIADRVDLAEFRAKSC